MSGIGIITNPYSKLNKRNPQLVRELEKKIAGYGRLFVTHSLEELASLPYQFERENLKILAICGGDGTISQTISAFARNLPPHASLPKIAILKGGTMNLIAAQIGQKGQHNVLFQNLIYASKNLSDTPTITLNTLKVEDHYGFLYADGSNVTILEEFYKKKSGLTGASWLTVKIVSSFLRKGQLFQKLIHPRPIKVSFDKHTQSPFDSLGMFAGTISKLPLGFPFLPFATEHPDQFQATVVTCKQEKLLWFLPLIMLQHKKGLAPGKFSTCCEKVTITATEPFHYTIDGEIYQSHCNQLTIQTGPRISFLKLNGKKT